jgi:hypothetical protein
MVARGCLRDEEIICTATGTHTRWPAPSRGIFRGMNTHAGPRVGIPLRPDRTALAAEQRRSLIRAVTGFAFSSQRPEHYVEASWSNDHLASLIVKVATKVAIKAATEPPMTIAASGLPEAVALNVLPTLAPMSAATRLFAKCMRVSLDGVNKISVPRVVPGKTPIFVAEAAPVPVIKLNATAATIGPAKKIIVDAAVTNELEDSGPEVASDIIGRELAASATLNLDGPVFDALAADDARPAGLLFGLSPLTASDNTGLAGIAADVASLAGAIADAGIGSDDMVIVTHSRQRAMIKSLVQPGFDYAVFGTPMVPERRVIGIAPYAVASAYAGVPSIEKLMNPAVHFEDTAPANIGVGTPPVVAAPAESAFQSDLTVVRVKCRAAWSVVAPGVAFIDSVNW